MKELAKSLAIGNTKHMFHPRFHGVKAYVDLTFEQKEH